MASPGPTPPDGTTRERVVALVPVGTLEGAKSRLGEVLDPEERRDLAERLLRATLAATVAAAGLAETIVVTPDPSVREIARAAGARPLRQRSRGLNAGLREARAEAVAAGATAVLVLPIDLVRVSGPALADLLAVLDRPDRPLVALVPDRHGRGTNALLLAPPDAIELCFGGDSRAAHRACARDRGARYLELESPLALDLDTPEDLLIAEESTGTVVSGPA